mmetsp:Transcript_30203/g.46185  ORF Transcript_30203/g.46185 Transcript_30203/m.46185 type:complete len:161 (+) Transcript_30203:665-1147(+)
MAETLTTVYHHRKTHPLLDKYKSHLEIAQPRDSYVLLGLLKARCRMERSPFFYLCLEGKSIEHKKPKEEVNETRFRLISRLVEVVEKMRELIEDEVLGRIRSLRMRIDREFMEETFNFIHPKTGYTPLHWLAYQGDYRSISYILDKIGENYADNSSNEIM